MVKRFLDIALAVVMLVLASPVMLICAIAIKLTSRGPVLFKQRRIGLNCVEFTLLKFRSMKLNSELEGDGIYSFEGDSRVTNVGRIIRKTSLDELPQLLNVLNGSMSIVGPRPAITYELGPADRFTPNLRRRFEMKPGLTGLAQVSGRSELNWDEKLSFDNRYIDQYQIEGIWLDIKIIARTSWIVLSGRKTVEESTGETAGPITSQAREAAERWRRSQGVQ